MVNYITAPAILYTGAGVSIISYDYWKKWCSSEMVPAARTFIDGFSGYNEIMAVPDN